MKDLPSLPMPPSMSSWVTTLGPGIGILGAYVYGWAKKEKKKEKQMTKLEVVLVNAVGELCSRIADLEKWCEDLRGRPTKEEFDNALGLRELEMARANREVERAENLKQELDVANETINEESET